MVLRRWHVKKLMNDNFNSRLNMRDSSRYQNYQDDKSGWNENDNCQDFKKWLESLICICGHAIKQQTVQ